MQINTGDLPVGSIVAATNAVAIKRYDREDGEYWMPAEGYPLPLSNQGMQHRTLRTGRAGKVGPHQ